MQQVIEFFDLLTDQRNEDVVWNFTFVSANSPFTVEGTPFSLRKNATAFCLVEDHVSIVERGFSQKITGELLDGASPDDKREIAVRMLKRQMKSLTRNKTGRKTNPPIKWVFY